MAGSALVIWTGVFAAEARQLDNYRLGVAYAHRNLGDMALRYLGPRPFSWSQSLSACGDIAHMVYHG